jgi:hypothetical protein
MTEGLKSHQRILPILQIWRTGMQCLINKFRALGMIDIRVIRKAIKLDPGILIRDGL